MQDDLVIQHLWNAFHQNCPGFTAGDSECADRLVKSEVEANTRLANVRADMRDKQAKAELN